jgi:antitoxin MazE
MLVHAKIQKWGNGLALRVSGAIRDIPQFQEGSEVDIEVSEAGFQVVKTIAPKHTKLLFKEAELLRDLDPKKGHADLVPTLLASEIGE